MHCLNAITIPYKKKGHHSLTAFLRNPFQFSISMKVVSKHPSDKDRTDELTQESRLLLIPGGYNYRVSQLTGQATRIESIVQLNVGTCFAHALHMVCTCFAHA